MLQTAITFRGSTTVRQCATLTMAMIVASPAIAHDPQDSYEMTVIRDAAYGSKVTSGKYDEAIAKIEGLQARQSEKFFISNNLCVAYTKANELELAERACNDALESSTPDRPFRSEHVVRIERKYMAMALSNRGVLQAVRGDNTSARQDFKAAMKLNAGLPAPARNLAHLETRTAEMVTALQTGH